MAEQERRQQDERREELTGSEPDVAAQGWRLGPSRSEEEDAAAKAEREEKSSKDESSDKPAPDDTMHWSDRNLKRDVVLVDW